MSKTTRTDKLVIFDFDGTIADSWLATLEIFNELSGGLGFEKISVEKGMELRNFSSKEIFFEKYKIPKWKMPLALYWARKKLSEKSDGIFPFIGIAEVISDLKKRGHMIGIVSSSHKKYIKRFLEKNSLADKIDFIEGGLGLFSKNRNIQRVIKRYGARHEDVVYIGDETRDIEAAQKSGVKTVAVTWGFNSEDILLKFNPDFVARKPDDIIKIIFQNADRI